MNAPCCKGPQPPTRFLKCYPIFSAFKMSDLAQFRGDLLKTMGCGRDTAADRPLHSWSWIKVISSCVPLPPHCSLDRPWTPAQISLNHSLVTDLHDLWRQITVVFYQMFINFTLTHTHAGTHAHRHARTQTRARTHVYTHTHTHAHTHTHIHMHANTHVRAHTHVYTHTYTHVYRHRHTHTHAHTYTKPKIWGWVRASVWVKTRARLTFTLTPC